MCQIDAEGHRCAPSTSSAFQRAFTVFDREPDGGRRAALVEEHKDALIAHALTAAGWRELDQQMAQTRMEFAAVPAANPGEQAGRQAYLAALRLVSIEAQIRTEIEAVRRRSLLNPRPGR